MTRDPNDVIVITIGDHHFSLRDLGKAADLPIDKAFQAILDKGLLGEDLKGVPWHTVIKSSGLSMHAIPQPEETLTHCLYTSYMDKIYEAKDLERQGLCGRASYAEAMALRERYIMACKLSKP